MTVTLLKLSKESKLWECFGNIMESEVIDTHIYGQLYFSGSTYFPPPLVIHMGDHYTQAPGIWGCVLLLGVDISISLDFT